MICPQPSKNQRKRKMKSAKPVRSVACFIQGLPVRPSDGLAVRGFQVSLITRDEDRHHPFPVFLGETGAVTNRTAHTRGWNKSFTTVR